MQHLKTQIFYFWMAPTAKSATKPAATGTKDYKAPVLAEAKLKDGKRRNAPDIDPLRASHENVIGNCHCLNT
jgi:hypothetical protein